MQKIYNRQETFVDDSIRGFVKCYHEMVSFTDCSRALKYTKAPIAHKVGVVTGGGWGHDPAFIGYIGKNMLDAVAIGNTFTPPAVEAFLAAFRAADAGEGVICLYGNYPKDIENAEIAIEKAAEEGIRVLSVIANDDVAAEKPAKRRGLTGEVLMWKIGGAAAARHYSLDQIAAVTQRAVDQMRTIGVGLASCIIPEVGYPNYLIEKGTMEVGVGHHGLFSMDTCKLRSADAIADIMVDEILKKIPLDTGDHVVVLVSGLGNTMVCELNILYSRVDDLLRDKGYVIHRALVGNYFTSLDMMGATLTIMKLDPELTQLFDDPAYAVALNHFNQSQALRE